MPGNQELPGALDQVLESVVTIRRESRRQGSRPTAGLCPILGSCVTFPTTSALPSPPSAVTAATIRRVGGTRRDERGPGPGRLQRRIPVWRSPTSTAGHANMASWTFMRARARAAGPSAGAAAGPRDAVTVEPRDQGSAGHAEQAGGLRLVAGASGEDAQDPLAIGVLVRG